MTDSPEKTGATAVAASNELVLPDESDQIIADLRTQLSALQDELAVYRQDETSTGGGAASGPEPAVPVIQWDDDFAPQVISRLQGPSQELTARLDRVIEQMQDPILREELERCRQTAYYLFETFRQISDHHRLLLASIEEDRQAASIPVFREQLGREFAALGIPVPLDIRPEIPEETTVPDSAAAVVGTIARIAGQLIGDLLRVEVSPAEAGDGGDGLSGDEICITVACTGLREDLGNVRNATQVVFRPGVSATTVVDWLYMEKIVELQGGSLKLYHEDGQAKGFRVLLPS